MRFGAFWCEVEFGDNQDEPGFIMSGKGETTGRDLTEAECEAFTDAYAMDIYEAWMEEQTSRAEDWADKHADR